MAQHLTYMAFGQLVHQAIIANIKMTVKISHLITLKYHKIYKQNLTSTG